MLKIAMRNHIHYGGVCHVRRHCVWCPKVRRPVLTDAMARNLRELLRKKVAELEGSILSLEIQPDHVHLFVEMPPRRAPAQIA